MSDFTDETGLDILAYLRGELSPADTQRIENLAAEDLEVAADIELQRRIMAAVKTEVNDMPASEFGWARLSKAMSDEAAQGVKPLAVSNDNNQDLSHQPLRFWRIAAAALAVISLGQAGFIMSKSSGHDAAARYVTVSEGNFIGIEVAFSPDAPQSHVTQLLQTVKGEMVSGPSTLGLYKVKFTSKDVCNQAVEAFHAADKVIETASNCE